MLTKTEVDVRHMFWDAVPLGQWFKQPHSNPYIGEECRRPCDNWAQSRHTQVAFRTSFRCFRTQE